MPLSIDLIKRVVATAMPWSAAHVTPAAKLTALEERTFDRAAYPGKFQKGDIIFGYTTLKGKVVPAIYTVAHVGRYTADPSIDIYWSLKLLGGYGPKEVHVKWGIEEPTVLYEGYFRDWELGVWKPTLNHFAYTVVRNGKTIWDVNEALAS